MSSNNPAAARKRQHYFMVAGSVVFRTKEDEEIRSVTLNTLVLNDTSRFSVVQISRAQQGLQMLLQKRLPDQAYDVIDVVILSIMALGVFTNEEFHARPTGMELQTQMKTIGEA